MRRHILALALSFLPVLVSMSAMAEDSLSAWERVLQQRRAAMMERGISSPHAMGLSFLGFMTYLRRSCGDEFVSMNNLDRFESHLFMGPGPDKKVRALEIRDYADALEEAMPIKDRPGKNVYCNGVRERFLKTMREFNVR